MVNEPLDTAQGIWQTQPVEQTAVPLAELRRRAQRLQTAVRWRNVREYAAVALVVAAFGYYVWRFPTPLVRAGAMLSIAGALWAARQLSARGAAKGVPAEMARRPCLAFHRAELERQRDLLRGVWRWYLLPLVPGLAVFLLGLAIEQAPGHWPVVAAVAVVCALGFLLVAKVNQSAALRLQHEIDALDDLTKEP